VTGLTRDGVLGALEIEQGRTTDMPETGLLPPLERLDRRVVTPAPTDPVTDEKGHRSEILVQRGSVHE
jgi:hypothetical protein